MVRLGDVASYMNGYAFKPSDWSDTGLPIIRIQDLTGNSYQANRYNGEYALKYEVNQGDVLISWSASLGVYVWQGEKALLNQHIFIVIFDKTEISISFFVHQVENIYIYFLLILIKTHHLIILRHKLAYHQNQVGVFPFLFFHKFDKFLLLLKFLTYLGRMCPKENFS